MSIDDALPAEWDAIRKGRYHDNRPYDMKDATCTLVKPMPEVPYAPSPDPVNHPQHYTVGPTEVIDIIRQQQGSAVEFHYEAALLKYVLRWRYKNGVEDLEKARVYLDWLIEQKKSEQGG